MKRIKIIGLLALSLLGTSTTKAFFADLDVTHPYYYGIYDLYNENIIEGYQVGDVSYFRPTQPITRAAALKIIILASNQPEDADISSPFPDVNNEWFSPYVLSAYNQGIVNGFNDGYFYPGSNVTRAELIKMVTQAYGFDIPEQSGDEAWYEPSFNFAKEMNLIDEDKLPHEKASRGEVAEIVYRAKNVANQDSAYRFKGFGLASYYGEGFHGRTTASGEIYDQNDLTAAHRTFPFGTRLKVNYQDESVVVRVNDRGPYHQNRVLDLSEAAFSQLSHTGAGVIPIDFEVYQEVEDQEQSIPEYLREEISVTTRTPAVPDFIAQKIDETANQSPRQSYYSETIGSLSKDFYPNVELDRTIPQTIYKGSVISVQGRTKTDNIKKVKVFLANTNPQEDQKVFEIEPQGRKFNIPVLFDQTGTYQMGIVLDDESKSRVENIEVISMPEGVDWNTERISVSIPPLDHNINFEDERLELNLPQEGDKIFKVIIRQNQKTEEFFIEEGISSFDLPFDYFKAFNPQEELSIALYAANSTDGKLSSQTSYWQSASISEYLLIDGFQNNQTVDLYFNDYVPFIGTGSKNFSGRKLNNVFIRDEVYVTHRGDDVYTYPIQVDGDRFNFTVPFEEEGTYVVEVISEEGSILFNKAFYVSNNQLLLPTYPWQGGLANYPENLSRSDVRTWANSIRRNFNANPVVLDAELDQFAQEYAEKMAREDFIAHTSPSGITFSDRIKAAGIKIDLGENLALGSTPQLALMGLEDSGSHLKNMIHQKWTHTGIGIAQNKDGTYYIVQHFGKR